MKRKGVTRLNKDEVARLKAYLKKSRGYNIRSIKVRDDGNFQLSLREPTESGLTTMVVNRGVFPDMLAEEKVNESV